MYTLLVGVSSDPVLQHFYRYVMSQESLKVIFINVNRIGVDVSLSRMGWHLPHGDFVPHDAVSSVYNRMLSFCEGSNHLLQLRYYLNWLLDDYYQMVVNKPKDTLVNFSKVWQLDMARAMGFLIPDTHILANARLDIDFEEYIYKSISSIRSIVDHVRNNRQRRVHEPVLFQPDMGRVNIRVHVVRQACYALKITSQDVDYRYGRVRPSLSHWVLPSEIASLCCQMTEQLGLIFSGIDLMLYDNVYYFLEINPSPGYAFYEKNMLGSGISGALCRCLREI